MLPCLTSAGNVCIGGRNFLQSVNDHENTTSVDLGVTNKFSKQANLQIHNCK